MGGKQITCSGPRERGDRALGLHYIVSIRCLVLLDDFVLSPAKAVDGPAVESKPPHSAHFFESRWSAHGKADKDIPEHSAVEQTDDQNTDEMT